MTREQEADLVYRCPECGSESVRMERRACFIDWVCQKCGSVLASEKYWSILAGGYVAE